MRKELGIGQIGEIGDNVDEDVGIARTEQRLLEQVERVMPIFEKERATRADYHGLDVGQQRRLQLRRRQDVPAGDFLADFAATNIELGRHNFIDGNREE